MYRHIYSKIIQLSNNDECYIRNHVVRNRVIKRSRYIAWACFPNTSVIFNHSPPPPPHLQGRVGIMTILYSMPCYRPHTQGTGGKNYALCTAPVDRKSPWSKDLNIKTLSFPLHCRLRRQYKSNSPAIPQPSP